MSCSVEDEKNWNDVQVSIAGKKIEGIAGLTIDSHGGATDAPMMNTVSSTMAPTYTFPTDMKEGEVITIDGKMYDHTHAGTTITLPEATTIRDFPLADRISAKEIFERQFGVHRDTRTPAQWQKLINVYGIKSVCKAEDMDEATVRKHAGETFSQRLKRQFKRKNHHA